jgi:hypothetical protein
MLYQYAPVVAQAVLQQVGVLLGAAERQGGLAPAPAAAQPTTTACWPPSWRSCARCSPTAPRPPADSIGEGFLTSFL